MATTTSELQPVEETRDKGLKGGALGLISSVVMGVASGGVHRVYRPGACMPVPPLPEGAVGSGALSSSADLY